MFTFFSLWSMYQSGITPPEDLQRQCYSSSTITTRVFSNNSDEIRVDINYVFGVIILGGNFTRFDYGESGNLERYGTAEAPKYQMELVTAPVYLLWSKTDPVSTPRVFYLQMSRHLSISAH